MDGPSTYLLIEREFIKTREPVVKPGRTCNLRARMAQYPKGSRCIATTCVSDCVQAEHAVLTAFKALFKRRLDIGAEYFQPPGDF